LEPLSIDINAALMTAIPELARLAMEQARRGDLQQALHLAQQALAQHPLDTGLMLFIGMIHTRRMELEDAAAQFRNALRLAPADPLPRLELTRVLIGLNQLDEAERLLNSRPIKGLEPKRLGALINMRRGDYAEAAKGFHEIVEAEPRDFESWGNFGACLLKSGNAKASVDALTKSLKLRRDQQRVREAWVEAHIEAGTGEEALQIARHARATLRSEDPLVRVTIARLEDMLGRPEQALAALEDALALAPDHVPALVAIARLHERQNRLAEFGDAVASLESVAEPVAELPLLKAQLAFRGGNLEQALDLALAIPQSFEPGARAELIGKIHDRLGNSAEAFAAFGEMNQDNGLNLPVIEARSNAFRKALEGRGKTLSRQWVRAWPKSNPAEAQASPIFLVGFPRSGTTLLDTLMMGHPQLCVSEEKPMLDTVARSIGGYERLGTLKEATLRELRELYFEEARKQVPDLGNRMLVDKHPFAMIDAPLIHRLFPSARFIFAQRHPCDVVLSCFITRFEPNYALANFTSIEGTARIYDEIMRFWAKCRGVLPLIVHLVRYERLVEEAEPEMRALFTFLGIEWDPAVLDHRSIASERRFINTPSYSQVVEPLYDRSIGRWERYREQLEPVLPRLDIWASVMGYDI
jgi:tetratricopeptide (TPR) repeat protein